VSQKKEQGKWVVTFVMPSEHTLDTLPEPLDERIILKKVESKFVAALKYSGTCSKERYEQKRDILKKLVKERNLIPVGEPVFARYNAPFIPWFLRRNEVLITVYKLDYEVQD
ncbi:MAG: heme-binding protein, partial [Deltaproteobacteria bacterium]|nr:heme-binding protein [Deltaproteobacteria bacterium]